MTEKTPLALGTEDIRKLLMRYAIPAIIAMTAASLYNMMDSIFIGHGVGPWLLPDWQLPSLLLIWLRLSVLLWEWVLLPWYL